MSALSNVIYVGDVYLPAYKFVNRDVRSGSLSGTYTVNCVGNELPIDKFTFTVAYDDDTDTFLYLTKDEEELYLCAGSFPGTLGTSGWAHTRGNVEIDGNAVSYPGGDNTALLSIRPPFPSYSSDRFNAGDVLRIGIEVNSLSEDTQNLRVEAMRNLHSVGSVAVLTSETDLFVVSSATSVTRFSTDNTGKDVLTFRFTDYADQVVLAPYPRTESIVDFKITGIEFNGEMVYGSLYGEYDVPPALYVLKDETKTPAKDYLKDVAYGTPVWWFVGGSFFSKGYIDSIVRTAKNLWKVTCISGVGLLDKQNHKGGVYFGETSVYSLVGQIVNGAFPMYRDPALKEIKVYGWLPYDTARNNLHRLLFATGVTLTKRIALVDYTVGFLPEETTEVPSSRIALGGSVELQGETTSVEVTEHSFIVDPNAAEEILFQNGSSGTEADHLLVVFDHPVTDVNKGDTQLAINESGANYAIVSGTGTLYGTPYTHSTYVVTVGDKNEEETEQIKYVKDNCLVTSVNSYNVGQRVLDYYRYGRRIKAKIMLDSEKVGTALTFNDPFGDEVTAYLEKANVLVTSVRGANCELVQGYFPSYDGNNFENYVVLYGEDTTWAVPDDVTLVRIVLIGGGDGGSGGKNGNDGYGSPTTPFFPQNGEMYYVEDGSGGAALLYNQGQPVASGGEAGTPGKSGRILVVDKEVSNGEIFTFTFGAAGQGGAVGGNAGTPGTDTSAVSNMDEVIDDVPIQWARTTANGLRSQIGYLNPLNNILYGLPGEAGRKGGDGGQTDTVDFYGYRGGDGLNGENVASYTGGKGGKGKTKRQTWTADKPIIKTASGGGAGGAAYGENGGNGSDGAIEVVSGTTIFSTRGGNGGNGANASTPTTPNFGCGGGGGNGGGAGGNAGGSWGADAEGRILELLLWASPGTAGTGSPGGNGGAGCAIILW